MDFLPLVLGGALVEMHAKWGAISKAQQVLYGLPSRDVVSCSALVTGYAQGHAKLEANTRVHQDNEVEEARFEYTSS
jgi:hypothetical protein